MSTETLPEINQDLVFWGLFVVVILGSFITFLPTIIGRNKRNCRAIFALNFFAGWTFIGWVIALVWACSHDRPEDERLAQPLSIGSVMTLVICLHLALYVGFWNLAVKGVEVAKEEIEKENQRHEAYIAEIRNSAAEEEQAKVEAQKQAALAEQKRAEAARQFEAQASVPHHLFPPGVNSPEERRAYLQSVADSKRK